MNAGAAEPVRLRGHHLLCILTYVGRGYSPRFVDGMDAVVRRLSEGAPVLAVDGPDDICAGLLADDGDAHCLGADARERDLRALADVEALAGLVFRPGRPLDLPADWPEDWIHRLRAGFADGRLRPACAGCSWNELCTDIAATGFRDTRLTRRDPP